MKYLKKFNESTEHKVSSDILSYLKGINHKVLQEVISDLEKELQEEEPDPEKLMAYADDISVISDELQLDNDKIDTIYDEIYQIAIKRNEERESREFRDSLPPEEGGSDAKQILNFCQKQIDHYNTKGDKITDIELGMIDAYKSILDKF